MIGETKMTFGQVIENIHFCKTLNPWLIVGIIGCIWITWLLNRDLEQQPIRYTLYGFAFGMTIKGVWNRSSFANTLSSKSVRKGKI